MPDDGFKALPGGGIVLRRPKPIEEKPGLLAGLLQRLMPQKPQPTPYWIAQDAPVAAREAVPMPAPAVAAAPGALPAYNGSQVAQWAEIENEAAKEQAIAEQLGPISKKILASKQLVEGKWFSP